MASRYAASATETPGSYRGLRGRRGWRRTDGDGRRTTDGKEGSSYLRHGCGHRYDHHRLEHVHHLLRNERVDRESSLRERREEHRGDDDPDGMIATHKRDGDPEESRARAEA